VLLRKPSTKTTRKDLVLLIPCSSFGALSKSGHKTTQKSFWDSDTLLIMLRSLEKTENRKRSEAKGEVFLICFLHIILIEAIFAFSVLLFRSVSNKYILQGENHLRQISTVFFQ